MLLRPQGARYRAIGPEASGGPSGSVSFTADVTEREEHHDDLIITDHPVENTQGNGSVSDHAYRRPSEVTLHLGWSDSGQQDPDYVQNVYAQLLRFQRDRWPFDLYTGKRVYSNMLLSSIVVETDQTTEFALRVDAHIREVILVQTQTASVSSDPSVQLNPSSSQPPIDVGPAQPSNSTMTTDQGFSAIRNGSGPTDIPYGQQVEGFNNLTSGTGPTQIPSGIQDIPIVVAPTSAVGFTPF